MYDAIYKFITKLNYDFTLWVNVGESHLLFGHSYCHNWQGILFPLGGKRVLRNILELTSLFSLLHVIIVGTQQVYKIVE